MRRTATAVIVMFCAASALAQSASHNAPQPTAIPPVQSTMTAPNVAPVLAQIDTTAQSTIVDLGILRINKWKADWQEKQQAESNASSVERNIREALPGLVAQLRADPQNVAASFKLYRNLNALYDVFSSLTESAGAFGSKEEFQALATDTNNLDAARRQLGDDVEQLATFTQIQLRNLQAERQQQAQVTAAAPTKTIIVDDETPKKKTVKKKKKPASTAAQPGQQQSNQSQPAK